MNTTKRAAIAAALSLSLACAARTSAFRPVRTGVEPAARVVVEGVYYWTDTARVAVGDVIEWVNRDIVDHTISFEGFSGMLKAKGTLAIRFEQPGVYSYYCDPHPSMRAVVIVR